MLDLRYLVENNQTVEDHLKRRRGDKLIPVVSALVELDKQRRESIQAVEALKQRRNTASQEIAKIKKAKGDASQLLEEMKAVSQKIKESDEEAGKNREEIQKRLYELPNLLDDSVPDGGGEHDNVEVRKWGDLPELSFEPQTHDIIGEKLGIMDFRKAGEVSGARFVFLKGQGARLERALIQFMLDTHSKVGYEELLTPFIVNRNALLGTGQLPKFAEDLFKLEGLEYYLIPTAEVPVTNYHREEILNEEQLPLKYMAYTPCFRSEAGSYGKDTKGLKRQHQFNKVELVKFVKPEESNQELELLLENACHILELLKLPYRIITLCSGDLGFSAAKTYDIEVWSPASKQYIEISSCSNFTDFQARRANIRYRDAVTRKVKFVHTINGSGLAVGRTMMAVIENFQTEDGNFELPEALKPYL